MLGTQRVMALQAGVLEWDLPESMEYQAGQALAVRLRVTNPTQEDREYQLYLGLFDPQTRQLIQDTQSVIGVDSQDRLAVPAGSYVELEGELVVDRTNVILAISLYDVAAREVVSQVAILLTSPSAGIWEQLLPLLGGVMVLGMVGSVVPMVAGMLKKKG